ncbi:sensor histidine kinase [Neptunitalea lumnitzerae]|uniref:histidine kinase n=1 Tax=Neptunitalea lumnitzerae TaxID=2965509 RepID=A0ABQ5MEI7_9FLAO|nr:sensor histidine kinase [Neptunitalea sp. Y10]GLB47806.1 hypothetical protein Y10_01740 [Neptunitalea sp. Y10]
MEAIQNCTKLQHTLEIAEIGQAYFNNETKVMYFDTVSCKIHETLKNRFSFIDLMRMYSTSSAKKYIETVRQGALTKQSRFDSILEIVTDSGAKKWIHLVGVPEYTKDICLGIQFLYKDVDQETREKMNLNLQSYTLDSSFKNATEGIAMVTIGGRFIKANPVLSAMLGYTEEELVNKPLIDFVPTEDLEELETVLAKFLMGTISQYQGEKQYINRLGQRIRVKLTISIIRDEDMIPLMFVIQLTDLTDIYQTEDKIKNLLYLVTDQNQRLLDFAYIISHNLRSHSSNLSMIIDLVKREFPKDVSNYYFPMLNATSKGLSQTMDDLNKAINSYSHNQEDVTEVNILEHFNIALNNKSEEIATIKAQIVNTIPDQVSIIHIPEYVINIFGNIIDNAIKFRNPDCSLKLEISHTELDDYEVIAIKDNGLGMKQQAPSNKLFGMYKTFHKNLSDRGIGLFIVKNQLEALKGKCVFESEEGVGSTFKIYFKK